MFLWKALAFFFIRGVDAECIRVRCWVSRRWIMGQISDNFFRTLGILTPHFLGRSQLFFFSGLRPVLAGGLHVGEMLRAAALDYGENLRSIIFRCLGFWIQIFFFQCGDAAYLVDRTWVRSEGCDTGLWGNFLSIFISSWGLLKPCFHGRLHIFFLQGGDAA